MLDRNFLYHVMKTAHLLITEECGCGWVVEWVDQGKFMKTILKIQQLPMVPNSHATRSHDSLTHTTPLHP